MLKGVGADIIHRLGVVCIGKLMPQMEANGGYTVLIFGMSPSQAGVFLCGWEGPLCPDHFEQLQAVLWSESLCPERHRADRGRLREQRAICRRSLESARSQ